MEKRLLPLWARNSSSGPPRVCRAACAPAVAALAPRGVRPGLAVVLAGDDPASRVYVRNKTLAAEQAGVASSLIEFPGSVTEAQLMARHTPPDAEPSVQ